MAKSVRTFSFEVCRRQNIRPYLCYGESEALQAPLASRLALDLQLRFTGLHILEQEMVQNGHLIAVVFNIKTYYISIVMLFLIVISVTLYFDRPL